MLSVMEPAAVPPIVLLLTVTACPEVPLTRIPRNPVVVPVPPELMVTVPMLLLAKVLLAKLKS